MDNLIFLSLSMMILTAYFTWALIETFWVDRSIHATAGAAMSMILFTFARKELAQVSPDAIVVVAISCVLIAAAMLGARIYTDLKSTESKWKG